MKKLDIGRLGLSYVAVLWLGATSLILVAVRNWILEYRKVSLGVSLDCCWSYSGVVLLGAALVHGIASWGVFRKRLWSYYLSLAISVWWVINGAYDFFALPFTGPRHWTPAILLVLAAVALAWLVSPALRSQFPRAFLKAKVA